MGEISVKIQRTRGKWKIRRKEVKYGVIKVLSLGNLGNFQRRRPLRSWVWRQYGRSNGEISERKNGGKKGSDKD